MDKVDRVEGRAEAMRSVSCTLWCAVAVYLTWGSVAAIAQAPSDPIVFEFLGAGFAVSPDGARIAYPVLAYDDTGDPITEVWTANADGSGPKRVGRVPGVRSVWWAGGDRLAATQIDADRVYFLPVAGGEPTSVSLTAAFKWMTPAPSPDGKWVAFNAVQREPGEFGVWLLETATGAIKRLSKDTVRSFVAWSPDSTRIAYGVGDYEKDYRLTVVAVEAAQATDTGLQGTAPAWSPDGKSLAYTGNVARGGSWWGGIPTDGSILNTNLETKQTTVLSDAPVNRTDEQTKEWEITGSFLPAWSPDGRSIAYVHSHQVINNSAGTQTSENEIWVATADGSSRRKVWGQRGSFAWAPDSKSLLIKGEQGLTRVAVDTGESRQIVTWALPTPPQLTEADYQTMTVPHGSIKYARVPEAYAKAILTVATTARDTYATTYKCDMPDTIGVTVTRSPSEQTALWTDGESHMFLTVSSMDALAPPPQSGVFNIYGICHELGHIAMYRRIEEIGLPAGVGEGWAHYAGSVVTDAVYAKHGAKLWPEPYDYRADGLARLRQQADRGGGDDPMSKAALAFYGAHERYGAAVVFAAMNEATRGMPLGKDVMPRFVAALAKLTGDKYSRDLFPEEIVSAKVQWQVGDRRITDRTVEGVTVVKDATGVLLRYDTDHSDGMLSTAGSGHAVVFRRPAGKWAVDAVEMFGSRYGETEPPKEDFSIFICDQDFNVIKEVREPYAKLVYGEEPKWHHFDFAPVTVPEGFYVCIFFNPTYTKGFYMHYEQGHVKSHSFSALPWSFVQGYENDWMIRVHLREEGR
jgi:Tol biopolymer transport system component